MAGGFNMMELMNKATQGEAKPKYEAATLPIEKIIPSPGNFYSMEGIEELADSILLARGVLQNIVVRSADADGRYMIISGHRRVAACRKLVEDGHAEFGEIAALIENEADENLRELMLIYTNSTSRILTDAEKMRQAQKATEILKSLKAEGKFEGRIREAVSRMLDTTGAQLARYAAIDKNLTNPELKEAFEDGRLKISSAYEASGLSEEGQKQVAEKLQEGGAVSIQDVKEIKEGENQLTNREGIPIKKTKLNLLKKFKTEITINTIEKNGKFYSSSDGQYKLGGWGSHPSVEHDTPYDTEQKAIEAEIKKIAERAPAFHKILWESGFHIVGDTYKEAEEAPPAVVSRVEQARAKCEAHGFYKLTDCEKCKIITGCEDCCRTCPPEKHCNVRQCEIESKKEKERIAREQAEHNASTRKGNSNIPPNDHEAETDQEETPAFSPEIYALTTIINDLEALQENYLGAAERHVAMGGDHAGKVNLETTAHHLQILINRTKSDLAFWKQKAESEKE